MDDMWLRFSREQKLDKAKSIQVAEYVIPRRFNGDIKHDVLKLWGVIRNQPGPANCGIKVHFWTSRDGEDWEELGSFPEKKNLTPGTVIMACRVPEGLKNYLALTYELTGEYETAPVVEAGLVEKLDESEKVIVMQGGYRDMGEVENFQAALRELKRKMGTEEVSCPPISEDGAGGGMGIG